MNTEIESVKSKIAKLMAMASHPSGNENEAEIAMRQAQSLMRKHGIAAAEIQINSGKRPTWNWVKVCAPIASPPVWTCVTWAGQLALGIARFTDTIAIYKTVAVHGQCVEFSGDESDVQFAIWLFKYLRDSVRAAATRFRGNRGTNEAFRRAMVGRVNERMRVMRAESEAELRRAATGYVVTDDDSVETTHDQRVAGTALAILGDKIALRDKEFGRQKVRASRGASCNSTYATSAGRAAGDRVNINRVVNGTAQRALGN